MGTEITRTDVLARASELLTRAEALITPPRRWTQRAHARDARGHIVSYIAPDARAWCLLGAIDRMYMAMLHMQPRNVAMYQRARRAALRALARATGADVSMLDTDGTLEHIVLTYNDRAQSKRAVLMVLAAARREIDVQLAQVQAS
jgi:hypothetical protein